MALKGRTQLAQRDHIFDRAESGKCETDVEAGRFVPSRPDDPVAVGPVGIPGIMSRDLEIERGRDVHDRESPACMSRPGRMQCNQIVAAHQVGSISEFIYGIFAENLPAAGVDESHGSPFLRWTAGERFPEGMWEAWRRP